MTRLCFAGSAGSSAQFSQRPIQEQKNQAAALQRKNSALEVGPLTWQVQLVSSKTWDFWGCFTMFHHVSPCFTMFHHVSPCFTIQPLRYHTSIPILKHSSGEARVVSRAGRNKSNLPDRCNEATDFPLAKPNIPGDLNRSWQQRIQTVEHKEIELKISMAVLKLTSKLGGPKL